MIKSTLNDVRTKIADLRAKTAAAAAGKQYDFELRLQEIKAAEVAAKVERKDAKRRRKDADSKVEPLAPVDEQMRDLMGFAGFGAARK